jgi:peptide/nickel transport system permease protein
MTSFIIRRLIQSIVVVLIVSIMVFMIMRLLPGDPIRLLVTQNQQTQFTEEKIALLRHEAGLDRPLIIQYFSWIGGVLHADLGSSILEHISVGSEIGRRLPVTLSLGLPALIIGLLAGTIAGILCAVKRGQFIDVLVTTLANIGITVPVFWLGFLLIYFLGLRLHWLPTMGYTSLFDDFWLGIKQMIMPIICLTVFPMASTARQVRSSMLEVMTQDYIRTAFSKGLNEQAIIIRHALKNSLIPVVTLTGVSLSIIIGGSAFVETVFSIPGIGSLAVASVFSQDYPYVQGIVLIITIAVVLINLLVDVAYSWLDPRIRFG